MFHHTAQIFWKSEQVLLAEIDETLLIFINNNNNDNDNDRLTAFDPGQPG